MTSPDAEPLYLTLAIPAGAIFGNVAYVEDKKQVYACIPTPSAQWELAKEPFVVVTVGAGRPEVPAGRDEAEVDTLADGPLRRAKLVAVGGDWMRVEWLPEEPESAVGLVQAAQRFAFSKH